MKRLMGKIAFILVILLGISSLVGCSSQQPTETATNVESQGEERIELKFLHKWPQPQNMPYFEEVIAAFEEAHPNIKINMEAVGDEPIKDKLRVLMGTDSQPDIFFSWSGEFAKKFVRSGNALDLTNAFNEDVEWKNRIMKAGIEPFTYDEKIYGVPLRINGKFFVYNKEMFQEYKLQEPKTWDQFMNVLETLKKNDITPIAFGNIYPWAGCHYLTGLNQKMVSQEVRMKDYNPKNGEFIDPGYVQALEYFKSLQDKGYFNDGVNSTEHNMANQMFMAGQAGMVYVELEEFQEIENGFSEKWDFFSMPAIEEGKGNQNYLTGAPDGFMISAKTKYPEEAIMFLKFLTSQENGEKLVAMLGWPSPIIGAVNDKNAKPYLVEGMKEIQEAEGMALWLDTDIHIKISDVYLPGLQELINGTKTPEQLMKEVQKVAQEVKNEVQ